MPTIQEMLAAGYRARREDQPDEALKLFTEAVAVARRDGSRRELIATLAGLGQIERDRGEIERALELYEEAVDECREHGDGLLLAHKVRHVGDIHREAGRLDEAEPCYAEAAGLYRAAADPPALDVANALRPYALLKEARGDLDAAAKLWREARALYDEAEVEAGVEEADAHLADLDR